MDLTVRTGTDRLLFGAGKNVGPDIAIYHANAS